MASFKIWTAFSIFLLSGSSLAEYEPTWESLDSRPLPSWYDKAKIGIFLHWGLYSVPSYNGEWFWAYSQGKTSAEAKFLKENYPPNFTYQDFGREFTCEFYNPEDWAEIFEAAGAKYVVLTSKHHEGYTMWPSRHAFSWNSKDVGSNRDLLGELATAIRKKTDLKFGVYYSLYEWYHPVYEQDRSNKFETQDFVEQKMLPELHDLVETYHPEVIWADGDWEANDTYFASREFLAWLYNESPVKDTIVVNDRWGKGIPCAHGDFFTCKDRYNPGVLQPHKWEGAQTIDKNTWGYSRISKLSDYLTSDQLIDRLVMVVSCGGNYMMNVGPSKDGMIPTIFEARLRDVGKWLKVNGEAIYNSEPWIAQNDTSTEGVWYTMQTTSTETFVYAFMLDWPSSGVLFLGTPVLSDKSKITMLGVDDELSWSQNESGLKVTLPNKAKVATDWAWTLKITDVIGTTTGELFNLINYEPHVVSLNDLV